MKKLIFFVTVLFLVPIAAWLCVLGVNNTESTWGNFGAFLGGVLSPLFSLVSIIFVYFSIKHANNNHQSQLNQLSAYNRRDQLIQLINVYNTKLGEFVNNQFYIMTEKNLEVNVYDDKSKLMEITNLTIRNVMLDFNLNKKPNKAISKEYIDVVATMVANVELCFCKILDLLNSIDDHREFEDAVDLTEALCELHTTLALLEFNLSTIKYFDKSPLLDRLAKLNEKTSFRKEIVDRYIKLKELKAA